MNSISKVSDISIRMQDESGREYLLKYNKPVNVSVTRARDCMSHVCCRIDFEMVDKTGSFMTGTALNEEGQKDLSDDMTPSEEIINFLRSFVVKESLPDKKRRNKG